MILLIDNYDSFVYNIYQIVGDLLQRAGLEPDIHVVRNDAISIDEIEALAPDQIILSPGPGKPQDAGICVELIKHFYTKIPILGICLGHQAIGYAFGATVTYAHTLHHGKTSSCYLDVGSPIFMGCEKRVLVGRYHSLCVTDEHFPSELRVIARAQAGEIMALQHVEYPVYGLQFHPESILTKEGERILSNFLFPKTAQEEVQPEAITQAIAKLTSGSDVGYDLAKATMSQIMSGNASEVKKSAYLSLLSLKGETIEEITASAEEMRNHCLRIHPTGEVLEIVGTGGDRSNSFNISTTASLIIAACGVPVAKHGNRAASSRSGSADCLEALGVRLDLSPAQNEELLREIGICFFFAQHYHKAMKYVAPVRKELGIRTIFNVLGPLANPASASLQIMGVYDDSLLLPMAKVLANLGVRRGMVVYGQDRMDEISICAPTSVCEFYGSDAQACQATAFDSIRTPSSSVNNQSEFEEENGFCFRKYIINPTDFGMKLADAGALLGGTPLENAQITRSILQGERGPKRDAAVLNAACALYIAGKAASIADGVVIANEAIDQGYAMRLLEDFIRLSNAPRDIKNAM
ncbi:MAG: anthranilate phosphoribosyltransferase [Clostridium sp.]|jgi:anthranilate synthase/phosphoribosyltransferase|nr:anthranilate phosphoribosyltransferase [Clostridium sp.]